MSPHRHQTRNRTRVKCIVTMRRHAEATNGGRSQGYCWQCSNTFEEGEKYLEAKMPYGDQAQLCDRQCLARYLREYEADLLAETPEDTPCLPPPWWAYP